MKLTERREIFRDDLRNLCVKHNWYTCGDNEEYTAILNYADSAANVTTEDIVRIAEDIKAHSETEYDVSNICFEVARLCYSFFDDVVDRLSENFTRGGYQTDEQYRQAPTKAEPRRDWDL